MSWLERRALVNILGGGKLSWGQQERRCQRKARNSLEGVDALTRVGYLFEVDGEERHGERLAARRGRDGEVGEEGSRYAPDRVLARTSFADQVRSTK